MIQIRMRHTSNDRHPVRYRCDSRHIFCEMNSRQCCLNGAKNAPHMVGGARLWIPHVNLTLATITTLIKDLDDRGLLDTTLVIIMSEFGRAPLIAPEPNFPGNNAGRKHWANAYSIALAGAGVQRGAVIGATDRLGGEVIADRYAPWDVTATIFNALGISVDTHYLDPVARPLPITTGTPIEALYKS